MVELRDGGVDQLPVVAIKLAYLGLTLEREKELESESNEEALNLLAAKYERLCDNLRTLATEIDESIIQPLRDAANNGELGDDDRRNVINGLSRPINDIRRRVKAEASPLNLIEDYFERFEDHLNKGDYLQACRFSSNIICEIACLDVQDALEPRHVERAVELFDQAAQQDPEGKHSFLTNIATRCGFLIEHYKPKQSVSSDTKMVILSRKGEVSLPEKSLDDWEPLKFVDLGEISIKGLIEDLRE